MSLDGRTQIGGGVCHRNGLIGELDFFAIWPGHNSGALASEQDFGTGRPGFGRARLHARFFKLLIQPCEVSLKKIARLRLSSAAWNGHARRAIGSYAQNISSRSSIPDKANRHGARTN